MRIIKSNYFLLIISATDLHHMDSAPEPRLALEVRPSFSNRGPYTVCDSRTLKFRPITKTD